MSIEIRSLVVALSNRHIIHDASIVFEEGCWTGILGANGSGKSTLLRAVCGHLPILGGAIEIDGRDCTEDPVLRATTVAMAPDPRLLPAALTGFEALSIAANGLTRLRSYVEGDYARLWEVLNLRAFAHLPVRTYSEGMKQRLSIMAAFVQGCRYVIVDEPFNWLDPVGCHDLKQEFVNIKDSGIGLITALQESTTLQSYCDKGYILSNGCVMMEVDKADLGKFAGNNIKFEKFIVDALRGMSSNR